MPNIDLDDPDSGPIAWNEHQRRTAEVTDGELLRLARKAWPDGYPKEAGTSLSETLYIDDNRGCGLILVVSHPRARSAMHAALKVLAGEE